jgi:hypothetical protein
MKLKSYPQIELLIHSYLGVIHKIEQDFAMMRIETDKLSGRHDYSIASAGHLRQ